MDRERKQVIDDDDGDDDIWKISLTKSRRKDEIKYSDRLSVSRKLFGLDSDSDCGAFAAPTVKKLSEVKLLDKPYPSAKSPGERVIKITKLSNSLGTTTSGSPGKRISLSSMFKYSHPVHKSDSSPNTLKNVAHYSEDNLNRAENDALENVVQEEPLKRRPGPRSKTQPLKKPAEGKHGGDKKQVSKANLKAGKQKSIAVIDIENDEYSSSIECDDNNTVDDGITVKSVSKTNNKKLIMEAKLQKSASTNVNTNSVKSRLRTRNKPKEVINSTENGEQTSNLESDDNSNAEDQILVNSVPKTNNKKPEMEAKLLKTVSRNVKANSVNKRSITRKTAKKVICSGNFENAANNESKNKKTRSVNKSLEDPSEGSESKRYPKRNRYPILDFWRNQRIEYEAGGTVLSVNEGTSSDIMDVTITPKAIDSKKSPPLTTNRKSRRTTDVTNGDEPTSKIAVLDITKGKETLLDCVQRHESYLSLFNKDDSESKNVIFSKLFDTKKFAMGFLNLKPKQTKSRGFVQENTIIFWIRRGRVEVTIHESTLILGEDDSFYVPQGNAYKIVNLEDYPAEFVFFQLKK